MSLSFSKYQGCGNDFILIDNRSQSLNYDTVFFKRLCHRRLGVGADGVIFLENSNQADFKMRTFNANGIEAEMCGNGMRCLGKFIQELGFKEKKFLIETMNRQIPITINHDTVTVNMGKPTDVKWNQKITIEDKTWTLDYLDTGVPHAVIFVEDLDNIPIESLGSKIRHHPHFAPRGANVNFATLIQNKIYLRTYERGVEGETLGCGTGAAAVALTAAKKSLLQPPIKIISRSDEPLAFDFKFENDMISDVLMTGPANHVFSGNT